MSCVSYTYEVPLTTKTQGTFILVAQSVDGLIVKDLGGVDIDDLSSHFPQYRGDFWELQRECSRVDILIGLSDQCLFANKLCTSVLDNNLEIKTGELGNVLSGTYINKSHQFSHDNSVSIQINGQSFHAGAVHISDFDKNELNPNFKAYDFIAKPITKHRFSKYSAKMGCRMRNQAQLIRKIFSKCNSASSNSTVENDFFSNSTDRNTEI